jgi:elongation factor G
MVFSAVILTVVLAMEAKGNHQVINVKTPLAELDRYFTSLLSIMQGKGSFISRFFEYAIVLNDVQCKFVTKN